MFNDATRTCTCTHMFAHTHPLQEYHEAWCVLLQRKKSLYDRSTYNFVRDPWASWDFCLFKKNNNKWSSVHFFQESGMQILDLKWVRLTWKTKNTEHPSVVWLNVINLVEEKAFSNSLCMFCNSSFFNPATRHSPRIVFIVEILLFLENAGLHLRKWGEIWDWTRVWNHIKTVCFSKVTNLRK